MTEPPEELTDDGGKWIRRDVLIDEMVEEDPDTERSDVTGALDEMVKEGPMRAKEMSGHVYVQLKSRSAGVKAWAKYKAQQKRNEVGDAVTRYLGGNK